jgi:hypothetical protein
MRQEVWLLSKAPVPLPETARESATQPAVALAVTPGQPASQLRARDRPDDTESQADGIASLLPPAGPRAQGWTGKCKSGHCQCLAEAGIHPLAIGQDRPSPLPGRVADGERMNPRKGVRVRANAGDDEHQGAEHGAAEPPRLGATLGATRMNDFPIRRTSTDSRQEGARGHGPI